MNSFPRLVFAVGLIASPVLLATDMYFSPQGDDGNSGTSIDAPRKSVTAWIMKGQYASGDVVNLLPGTHDRINWGYHGTSTLQITIRGVKADGRPAGRGEVIVDGRGTNTCCRMIGNKLFEFRDITFRNGFADGCNGGGLNGQDKATASYVGTVSVVSNCVFENCSSTGTGGAVWLKGGTPQFVDCLFSNCKAKTVGAVNLDTCSGAACFTRCTFDSNVATNGVAGAVNFGHNGNELVNFGAHYTDCLFTNNYATSHGGAIQGLVAYATNTTFAANRSGGAGGVWYYASYATQAYEGNYVLTNFFDDCRFVENRSVNNGGAFGHSFPKRFRFKNCRFERNGSSASGGVLGGLDTSAYLEAEDCSFVDNRAKTGGVFALGKTWDDTPVRHCRFVGNAATNGSYGVISSGFSGSELATIGFVLSDCAFTNNTATGDGGAIGGLVKYATNCIFSANVAQGKGGVWYYNGFSSQTYSGSYTLTNFFDDCVFDGNRASKGAVFASTWTKRFRLDRCLVQGNVATSSGALYYGESIFDYNFRINRCLFPGDDSSLLFAATGGMGVPISGYTQDGPVYHSCVFMNHTGSALTLSGLKTTVEQCVFTGNSGDPVIAVADDRQYTIRGCLFTNNLARILNLAARKVQIERCTFSRNTGDRILSMSENGSYVVRNCLFADNVATNANGGAVAAEWRAAKVVKFESNTLVNNISAQAPYAFYSDSWCTDKASQSYTNNLVYGNRSSSGQTGIQVSSMFEAFAANCWFEKGGTWLADGTRDNVVAEDPKFVAADLAAKLGVSPYLVDRHSRAYGTAAVLDWMDETTVDLAGKPRLRDGACDIGCLQNHLPVPGLLLMVR